jgi:hypothetical protein
MRNLHRYAPSSVPTIREVLRRGCFAASEQLYRPRRGRRAHAHDSAFPARRFEPYVASAACARVVGIEELHAGAAGSGVLRASAAPSSISGGTTTCGSLQASGSSLCRYSGIPPFCKS